MVVQSKAQAIVFSQFVAIVVDIRQLFRAFQGAVAFILGPSVPDEVFAAIRICGFYQCIDVVFRTIAEPFRVSMFFVRNQAAVLAKEKT